LNTKTLIFVLRKSCSEMEFWASEVKSGESLKVEPGEGLVLHLSQANLGEIKKEKGNESVCLFVNVDGKKLVLGTLFSEKLPQQQFDLVFDQDFELSHNWKGGSVYFFGYRAANPIEDEEEGAEFDSDSEEDIPLTLENNGKPEGKAKEEKSADAKKPDIQKDTAAGKKKVTAEKSASIIKSEDSDDSDDDSDENDDTDMDEGDDDSDSGDEEDGEEETPAKVEPGKKRAQPETTPAASKKVKLTTPQKTDGKKGTAHVATPHPSKPAGKTTANPNQKTPKSGGSHVCKTCSRTFNSEGGLDSHTKAKHSAAAGK